ncbi:MAPEG family protein, partial [Acinetobacter nosocomialis]|uniref:MAPEG family protein n=1 Tax=Acinetobacter nosocomialis TaxID=106654 RepID=UPI0030F834C1
IAKFNAGFKAKDNQNPREFLAKSTGIAARANAAQQNSFESLPLFISAILMAEYMVVPEKVIMTLGWAYIVCRVIYGICYL